MATAVREGGATLNEQPAPDAAADVITLDHVHKVFGSFTAVHDANFSIRAGEFFSLLGPSGCGKTTMLRMIAGFEQPSYGRVLLDGQDVSKTPPYKRHVNTVFQQYALFPHMSVFDNVAFGPRSRKDKDAKLDQRVNEMLEVVRLGEFARRRPSQLSGGQQQRVALARALVNLPSALLLDEPLAALDLKLRQAMQLELKRIQREVGITFVFVTHDQNEALTMSDRLVVMNNGLIEQLGSPREVYERPHTRFVAGFIGTSNLIEGKVARLDGTTAVLERGPGETISVPDAVRAGASTGGRLHITVRPEKIILTESEPAPGRCALRGRVAEVVYLGSSTQYAVRLSDGTELSVYVQNSSDSSDIADRDQDVWLSWRPEHTLALADSPTDTTAALGGAA
jgi:spermidine/putrescine transport system ATP-binding protein